jgi:hypothetical protein
MGLYLNDARNGKQLNSATLMTALAELGPGSVLTLTSTGATVTINGTSCSAPTPEAALTGAFTPMPKPGPTKRQTAITADLAAVEKAVATAEADNGAAA